MTALSLPQGDRVRARWTRKSYVWRNLATRDANLCSLLCFLESSNGITSFFFPLLLFLCVGPEEIASHVSFLSQTKVGVKSDQLWFDYRNKKPKSGWSRKVLVYYFWFSEVMTLFRKEFSALDWSDSSSENFSAETPVIRGRVQVATALHISNEGVIIWVMWHGIAAVPILYIQHIMQRGSK